MQAAMFERVERRHGYGTRAARSGLAYGTADHRSVGYAVPSEWGSLTEEERGQGSLAAFKRGSRASLLAAYGRFSCRVVDCRVCQAGAGLGVG